MTRRWTRNARAVVGLSTAVLGCSPSIGPEPVLANSVQSKTVEGPAEQHKPNRSRLTRILDVQPAPEKTRYAYRHPLETLEFFGVQPAMTVVDSLPGRTWYVGILLDYLGSDGRVIPADYSPEMWATFGDEAPDPESRKDWPAKTVRGMGSIRQVHHAQISAFQFGYVPDELTASADVVLMIRALHHFMRLEGSHGYLTQALASVHKVLKPSGIVGVVQHRAPESTSDEWAGGTAGYVKQSAVVAAFEHAGFEFIEASEINANALDIPTEEDVVWRLPPELKTSGEDVALKQKMLAIGESDRMTLKFRKPE